MGDGKRQKSMMRLFSIYLRKPPAIRKVIIVQGLTGSVLMSLRIMIMLALLLAVGVAEARAASPQDVLASEILSRIFGWPERLL
jgi:hypothetical protein